MRISYETLLIWKKLVQCFSFFYIPDKPFRRNTEKLLKIFWQVESLIIYIQVIKYYCFYLL